MASDGRKSLMIDKGAHAHIMQLAETFGVAQPEIVEALLKCVDRSRLSAALSEIANSKAASQEEQRKKRVLLEKALADRSSDEIAKLLASLGVHTD
jgi:hypothetical protein